MYFGALPFAPIRSALYQKFHDDTLFPSVSGGFILTEHKCSHVVFHDNNHVSGSDDNVAQAVMSSIDTVSAVMSVAFSPDGKLAASGSHNGAISLWNAETGKTIASPFKGHTDWVASVTFAPDGSRLVSGSHDATIRIWDVNSGQTMTGPLESHTNWVTSVVFSPDGKLVASGYHDCTVCVWLAETGQLVAGPFEGHADWVTSVAFSPDGRRVASKFNDQSICVWDVETGQVLGRPFKDGTSWVTPVAFNSDCIGITSGITSRLYDTSTLTPGIQLSAYVTPEYACYIPSHTIRLGPGGWLTHMLTNRTLSKLPAMITSLCSASNETSIIIGTQDGQVIIINFPPVVFMSPDTRSVEGKL